MAVAVRQTTSLGVISEASSADPSATKTGVQAMVDFWLYHSLAGNMFQVRAGTITTPLVGDVVVTDTAAEISVDALTAGLIIPASLGIGIRLGTGTLHEYAVKSVAAPSTAGTAFVALPLALVGRASTATCRVSAAGGVTVAAEVVTTTRRHWGWSNPVAAGAGNDLIIPPWEPRTPPIIAFRGAGTGACLYVQIAATGTGPSYYAQLDYLDDPASALI